MITLRRLACGLLLAASSLAAQDVSFGLLSDRGNTGLLCAPWSCTPRALDASRGTSLMMTVRGGFNHVLLVSGPNARCLTIPGLGRSLIVGSPFIQVPMQLSWVKVYINGPRPNCSGWWGRGTIAIPRTVPVGSRFLLQVVGRDSRSSTPLIFSNAAMVTVR